MAEALAIRVKAIVPDLSEHASVLERTASEAVLETRRLAHGLMPIVAGAKGLRAALAELAASVTQEGKLRCSFSSNDPVEFDDEFAATQLLRIAQESVSNLIRHGHATEAALRLERTNGKTTLSISDNGAGLSRDEGGRGEGRGLRIMAYRAALIAYDLEIDSTPGSGATVMARQR
jgi:two-component system NarL family sensor kinase